MVNSLGQDTRTRFIMLCVTLLKKSGFYRMTLTLIGFESIKTDHYNSNH